MKTVVNYNTTEIKKLITSKNIRKDFLKVYILGYVTDGNREPFEADDVYYTVSVSNADHSFDIEPYETTSLAKAKQRAKQLYSSLQGYRGNSVHLIEYDESDGLYSDY